MSHHNELRDGVAYMDSEALTPTHVSNDPLINPGRTVWIRNASLAGYHLPKNPQGVVVY